MRCIEELGQAVDAHVTLVDVSGHDSDQPPRGHVTQQSGTFGISASTYAGCSAPSAERRRPSRNGPQQSRTDAQQFRIELRCHAGPLHVSAVVSSSGHGRQFSVATSQNREEHLNYQQQQHQSVGAVESVEHHSNN